MNPVNKIKINEFKGKHNTFGSLLLQPGINYTDSNRGVMFSAQLEQCTQIIEPQFPLFFSRFEKQWSDYSSGYTKLDGTWKVLAKIVKNKYNYAMIVQKVKLSDKEKKSKRRQFEVGEYHVIFRKECEHLTEKYGYKYNNEIIDNYEKGDFIKDKTIIRDNNRDENMNFTYGRNINAVYLSYAGLTTEDACVISQTTAKKLGNYFVKKIRVSLNTNDILTNLYGTKDFYKAFPDIGEEVKDGLVCSVRRIQYQTAPVSLSILNKPFPGDQGFRGKGTVVDINVICNMDDAETILDYNYNKQIKKYWSQERKFYENFVKFVTPIVIDTKNKVSNDLIYYYNRFKNAFRPI